MNRNTLLITVAAALLILEGCQNYLTHTLVDASSIPDQTYDVTVHERFMSTSYAVLFDIPGDGSEVFMKPTPHTQKMGKDSPRKYIDQFNNRIRFYRTIRIGDQDGTVRGYLMVSSVLNYWISPVGERIMVGVENDSTYR